MRDYVYGFHFKIFLYTIFPLFGCVESEHLLLLHFTTDTHLIFCNVKGQQYFCFLK
jgi:hypothetical protein